MLCPLPDSGAKGRDAGAVVAEDDGCGLLIGRERYLNHAAVAAVFRGVVQNVQKNLPKPERVARNERQNLLHRRKAKVDLVLLQQLAIGEDGVLQLGLNVEQLNVQLESAVLNAGEFQQLLHETREPGGLAQNGLDALTRFMLDREIKHQRFAPAGDGRERCAQLMRNGGDELRLHLFRAADFARDLIDRLAKRLKGLLAGRRKLGTVAPSGDLLCRLCDLLHRARHMPVIPQQRHDAAREQDQHRKDERGRNAHRAQQQPRKEGEQRRGGGDCRRKPAGPADGLTELCV